MQQAAESFKLLPMPVFHQHQDALVSLSDEESYGEAKHLNVLARNRSYQQAIYLVIILLIQLFGVIHVAVTLFNDFHNPHAHSWLHLMHA